MNQDLHIHIGHHYFGAGNIGDDMMVEGFLRVMREYGPRVRMTCAIPFDPGTQRLRFPDIEWLPYNPDIRSKCISNCDVWLGLGDSPFQIDSGPWFIAHLLQEVQLCKAFSKPMYYLCVGVNNREAMDVSEIRTILHCAEHIWTRDEQSAKYLGEVIKPARLTKGADLGYITVSDHRFQNLERESIGFLFNFERKGSFDPRALCEYRRLTSKNTHRWLLQEVRELPGSERMLLNLLPEDCRETMAVRIPDYGNGSLASLLNSWGTPEVLFSSRYHGAMVGAAMGARVVAIRRNEKIGGIANQLGLEYMDGFLDAHVAQTVVSRAMPVSRKVLVDLAGLARRCCTEFLEIAEATGG